MRLLSSVLLFSALPVMATEPFTGTWKVDMSKAKVSQAKPEKMELANGTYKCFNCDPSFTVKADGTDQPVTGDPTMDTLNVRIVDDHSVQMVGKKDGKVVFETKTTVSPDGMTATGEFTTHPPSSDQPVTGTFKMKRAGKSMSGMHAISGEWLPDKVENLSENALSVTFEESADGLKMTEPTGEHYDAKFDGKDYAYEGSTGVNKVTVKRVGSREIVETDKRDGKVESTSRMTLSPDGRTLTVVSKDWDQQGRVNTLIFNKQR